MLSGWEVLLKAGRLNLRRGAIETGSYGFLLPLLFPIWRLILRFLSEHGPGFRYFVSWDRCGLLPKDGDDCTEDFFAMNFGDFIEKRDRLFDENTNLQIFAVIF